MCAQAEFDYYAGDAADAPYPQPPPSNEADMAVPEGHEAALYTMHFPRVTAYLPSKRSRFATAVLISLQQEPPSMGKLPSLCMHAESVCKSIAVPKLSWLAKALVTRAGSSFDG